MQDEWQRLDEVVTVLTAAMSWATALDALQGLWAPHVTVYRLSHRGRRLATGRSGEGFWLRQEPRLRPALLATAPVRLLDGPYCGWWLPFSVGALHLTGVTAEPPRWLLLAARFMSLDPRTVLGDRVGEDEAVNRQRLTDVIRFIHAAPTVADLVRDLPARLGRHLGLSQCALFPVDAADDRLWDSRGQDGPRPSPAPIPSDALVVAVTAAGARWGVLVARRPRGRSGRLQRLLAVVADHVGVAVTVRARRSQGELVFASADTARRRASGPGETASWAVVGRLLDAIRHDLHNAIGIISGRTAALRLDGVDSPHVAAIDRAVDRQVEILQTVTSWRPRPTAPQAVDVVAMVRATLTGLQGMARAVAHGWTVVATESPLMIQAPPVVLQAFVTAVVLLASAQRGPRDLCLVCQGDTDWIYLTITGADGLPPLGDDGRELLAALAGETVASGPRPMWRVPRWLARPSGALPAARG